MSPCIIKKARQPPIRGEVRAFDRSRRLRSQRDCSGGTSHHLFLQHRDTEAQRFGARDSPPVSPCLRVKYHSTQRFGARDSSPPCLRVSVLKIPSTQRHRGTGTQRFGARDSSPPVSPCLRVKNSFNTEAQRHRDTEIRHPRQLPPVSPCLCVKYHSTQRHRGTENLHAKIPLITR